MKYTPMKYRDEELNNKKPITLDTKGYRRYGLDRARTCDPHVVDVMLSQLSYKTVEVIKDITITAIKLKAILPSIMNFI